jgi:peptidoglycan/LPS O-acetylase OafA/YrhL
VLFAITLVLSWILFSLVENPIMKRFASSRRGPKSRSGPPAPPIEEKSPQVTPPVQAAPAGANTAPSAAS